RLDALEVARRGDGEAGLDHVDAELGQRLGHADLLAEVHREAGRLLAVAQRGVEDDDAVFVQLAEAGVLDGHGMNSWLSLRHWPQGDVPPRWSPQAMPSASRGGALRGG